MNNKGYAEERLGGFRGVEITTEKNPTGEPIDLITDENGNLIGGIGNEPIAEVDPIIEPTVIPELENQNYFGKIHHSGFADNDEKQEMVQYAYSLGGIDFVKMIECENGNWDIKAIGDSGKAFGLCQINTRYHKLPNEYKTNWRVQVEYCYEKRSTGTRFYGPSRKVKGTSCANYVSDRFTILE